MTVFGKLKNMMFLQMHTSSDILCQEWSLDKHKVKDKIVLASLSSKTFPKENQKKDKSATWRLN